MSRDLPDRAALVRGAHCQGGHSHEGAAIADQLGIEFPLTMGGLWLAARRRGLDRNELWPWWQRMRDDRAACRRGECRA